MIYMVSFCAASRTEESESRLGMRPRVLGGCIGDVVMMKVDPGFMGLNI